MGMKRPQNDVRLPVWELSRFLCVSMIAAGLLSGAVALVRDEPGVLSDGMLALVVVIFATLAGLAVMVQAGPRPAGSWGLVLLIAQGVRMIGGLAIGVLAFFAARPEPMVFWMLFLVGMLAVLTGEVSYMVRWIRAESQRTSEEAA